MHTAKWKKPVWKGYAFHDSNYVTFRKRKNYRDSEKTSSFRGLREWGRSQQVEYGIFRAVTLFRMIRQCWINDIPRLSESIELYNKRVNSKVNYGIEVITRRHWFIHCNKCTTPDKMLITGGAGEIRGREICENSVLSAWFSFKSKTSLENKVYQLLLFVSFLTYGKQWHRRVSMSLGRQGGPWWNKQRVIS